MTTATAIQPQYLDGCEITATNKHLFSPGIQAMYEFFEKNGADTPIDPIKHKEAIQVGMRWEWRPKIQALKQTAPQTQFKEIVIQMLDDLLQPEYWTDDEVLDLIIWAKKTWQEANSQVLANT